MAFTGNKFEFRMLGASQSISEPNTVLNTIMAHELEDFAQKLEGAEDFTTALQDLIRETFTEHQRIIFNGNGYDESWIQEAKRRGLSNLGTTPDALPVYTHQKNMDLFTQYGIYSKEEIEARAEIHIENYTTTLRIEASTMVDMIRRQILPAVSRFAADLCKQAGEKSNLGVSCQYEKTTAKRIGELSDALQSAMETIEQDSFAAPKDQAAAMHFIRQTLCPDMAAARVIADQLELLTARAYWPFPVYSDLMFYN
jgi:glutamine synthetase